MQSLHGKNHSFASYLNAKQIKLCQNNDKNHNINLKKTYLLVVNRQLGFSGIRNHQRITQTLAFISVHSFVRSRHLETEEGPLSK